MSVARMRRPFRGQSLSLSVKCRKFALPYAVGCEPCVKCACHKE